MNRLFALTALAASTALATPAHADLMTPEDLVRLKRVGGPSVSPDGTRAIVPVSGANADLTGRVPTFVTLDLNGGEMSPSMAPAPSRGIRFGGDGALYYLSDRSGSDQLFRLVPGQEAVQVTRLEGGAIDDFLLSPDASKLVLFAERDLRCASFVCADVLEEKGRGSALEFDEIFVRQWDRWVEPGVKAQLFGFRIVDGRAVGDGTPLARGLTGNTPSRPFGGSEEVTLGNDGTVYFAQRAGGSAEPTSTNLDIFAVPIDGGEAVNLTDANEAYDSLPTLSPDGGRLAYVAMRRPGYESDQLRLKVRDLASGQTRDLMGDWDLSVGSIAWTADGAALIVGVSEEMEHPLYRIDAATGARERLTGEGNAGNAVPLPGGDILFTMNSLEKPNDIYRWSDGEVRQLTEINGDLLRGFDPITYEKFSFAGANGDEVFGFTLKPADAQGDLPVAFVVHGGPQGSFGNSWSTRWNPRMLSAPGYAVVSIDFHGSTGYGQDFVDSINRDWGGKPLQDLQLGLAHALERDEQLDGERICALGASYGGYMMNWIEGNWPDRFDCLINHNGLFDMRSFYYSTEELWFPRWDMGGSYADARETYERWNPVNHVDRWKTPMMVVLGLEDYRVPYTQGLGAFTALQERGVPSKLLVFPDENHWVLGPQNSIRWHEEVFDWMARWTADDEAIDRSRDIMQ